MKYFARVIIFLLLTGFTTCCCFGAGAEPKVQAGRLEVIDYGIYRARVTRREQDVLTDNSRTSISKVSELVLVERTGNVPCRRGVMFGFRYKVTGQPTGAPVLLLVKVKHPPMKNPGKGTLSESRWEEVPRLGQVNFIGLGFEKDWSMVPGTYRIDVYLMEGGPPYRLLVTREFQVHKSDNKPVN